MFTTMCALLASGFESDVSAENWRPLRAQLRDRMQHQEGPAVDAIREYYKQHDSADPGAALSRYLWFGLVAGHAPDFKPDFAPRRSPTGSIWLSKASANSFPSIIRNKISASYGGRCSPPITAKSSACTMPFRKLFSSLPVICAPWPSPSEPRTFTIIVEPLVGRITNVRNFGDHYAIVLSGADDIPVDVVRHAYLHFLLDPLPLRYSHVVAVKRPLFEKAAGAPRLAPDLKDDFPSYFAECIGSCRGIKAQENVSRRTGRRS